MFCNASALCGGYEFVYVVENFVHRIGQRRQNLVFHFVGIIESRFERCDKQAEFFEDCVDTLGHVALHKSVRRLYARHALCVYHIDYAFRVGKRKSSVEEGTLCELAVFCHNRAAAQKCVERALHYANAAVQIKLNRIFARIRAPFGEINGVSLVAKLTRVEHSVIHIKRRPYLAKSLFLLDVDFVLLVAASGNDAFRGVFA